MTHNDIATLSWGLLSALAGLCLGLVLLNRLLLLLRDSRWKGPLIVLVCGAVTGGFALAGLAMPGAPWAYAPLTVLALIGVGEVRRAVLRRAYAVESALEIPPGEIALRRPVTTTDVVVRRFRVALPGWRGPAFRIAHASDFHVNPGLPKAYYRRVLERLEEARADFVVLTGDFVTRPEAIPALAQLLRPLGLHGTFAVLGNHDYWAEPDGVRAALRGAGICLLTDEPARVDVDGGTIQIAGCDHPWGGRGCAIPPAPEGVVSVVLSHTPDNIYRISRQSAHLMFSGHNHAGQVRLPWLGSVVIPSRYGRRFDHGHFVVNGTHLFVTGGVGAANPPLRIYCRPDVFVVDVAGEHGGGA